MNAAPRRSRARAATSTAEGSTTEHYRTALRKGWRLTECELENAWAAAKIVWSTQGLEGGSERYYALARILEDRLMEKWRLRHT